MPPRIGSVWVVDISSTRVSMSHCEEPRFLKHEGENMYDGLCVWQGYLVNKGHLKLISPTLEGAALAVSATPTGSVSQHYLTSHVKLLKPSAGISGRQHSEALHTMRQVIKRPRRQHEAVFSVSHKWYLHLLLCKIPSRIISVKLIHHRARSARNSTGMSIGVSVMATTAQLGVLKTGE